MKLIRHLAILLCLGVWALLGLAQSIQAGSMQFSQTSLTPKQGELFEVGVVVDTKSESIGGAGARIKFDPKLVIVDSVAVGDIFADYPQVKHDNMKGELVISGISANNNSFFSGQGILATVRWQAVAAGDTKISFDFTPGSTTDSNMAVTFGNGDILSQVNELSLNIKSTDQSGQNIGGFFSRITSFFNSPNQGSSLPASKQTSPNNVNTQPISDSTEVVNSSQSSSSEGYNQPTPTSSPVAQIENPLTTEESSKLDSDLQLPVDEELVKLPQWLWFVVGVLVTAVVLSLIYYFKLRRQLKGL